MPDYQINMEDIELLKAQGMVVVDLKHSMDVAEKALEIGRRVKADVDLELIGRGALFHDLGKTVTRGLTHGLIGAEKGVELGLPPEVNRVMEIHIRGGLTAL